jgi:hypothetical protein
MDLTTTYPRSVKDKLAGVVMLARTTDKAKAKGLGNVGEYNYDCPMDKAVFGFLGIDADQFLETVKKANGDDRKIEAYAKTFADKKSPAEIEQFNTNFLKHAPEPGSEAEGYFLELRNQVAPDRTDVTLWADVLDLDEKRDVPKRTPVAH